MFQQDKSLSNFKVYVGVNHVCFLVSGLLLLHSSTNNSKLISIHGKFCKTRFFFFFFLLFLYISVLGLIWWTTKASIKIVGFYCSRPNKISETLRNILSGLERWMSGSVLFHPLITQGKVAFLRIPFSKKIC